MPRSPTPAAPPTCNAVVNVPHRCGALAVEGGCCARHLPLGHPARRAAEDMEAEVRALLKRAWDKTADLRRRAVEGEEITGELLSMVLR